MSNLSSSNIGHVSNKTLTFALAVLLEVLSNSSLSAFSSEHPFFFSFFLFPALSKPPLAPSLPYETSENNQ